MPPSPVLLLRASGWAALFDGTLAPEAAVAPALAALGPVQGRVLLSPVGGGAWLDAVVARGLAVTALDPSRRVLADARGRLATAGVTVADEPTRGTDDGASRVVLVHGDLREAECNDGHGAALVPPPALAALGTAEERVDALRTVAAAVRPGSRCVVVLADPPAGLGDGAGPWKPGEATPVVPAPGLPPVRRETDASRDGTGRLRVRHRFLDAAGNTVAETGVLWTEVTPDEVRRAAAAAGLEPVDGAPGAPTGPGLRFVLLRRPG